MRRGQEPLHRPTVAELLRSSTPQLRIVAATDMGACGRAGCRGRSVSTSPPSTLGRAQGSVAAAARASGRVISEKIEASGAK